MSHVATVKIEFKNKEILQKVCKKLGYTCKIGSHQIHLYSGVQDAEVSIKIPGWRYEIAIVGDQASFDNYNGNWGKMSDFEQLQQEYAAEVTLAEAQAMGYICQQEVAPDGSIQIELYR